MRRRMIMVAVCLVAYAVPSWGQAIRDSERWRDWDFSVQTRYTGSHDKDGKNGSSVSIDDDLGWGFGFGYHAHENLTVGFMFSWRTVPYDAKVVRADDPTQGDPYSNWIDTGTIALTGEWNILPKTLTAGGTVSTDRRETVCEAPPGAVFRAVCRIGGGHGWYAADWLWKLRGALDRLVGGPGLRRGRRDPDEVGYGEALDLWRVTGIERGRRLSLRAEMKLPCEALLEFTLAPEGGGTRLAQTARCGILYSTDRAWISLADDLLGFRESKLLSTHKYPWEPAKLGVNTPPSKPEHGWLTSYHAVGPDKFYRLGALILHMEDQDVTNSIGFGIRSDSVRKRVEEVLHDDLDRAEGREKEVVVKLRIEVEALRRQWSRETEAERSP